MSIRKIIGVDGGIQQLRFQVFPKAITLPRNIKSFALYLEKGMQIMGKFQSNEGASLKDSFYRFRHPQPAIFRIHNLAHSDYTWSLYSVDSQETSENLEDSAIFNIERTIKLYQMELLEKQREIQTSIKERNVTRAKVLQLWGLVRKEMKSCRSTQKCVFIGRNYQIEFQVEIKNALDFQLQRMEEQQNIETLRRSATDTFRFTRHDLKSQPNVIELNSAYHSSPLKQDEPITKETIERELSSITIEEGHSPNDEDFNAIVKIVDPQGEEIADKSEEAQRKGLKETYSDNLSYYGYPATGKKFSLLSDIIQRSHEGSSSFGNPDRSSSNGHRLPFRKDTTLDIVIQPQNETSAGPLNKFKTLPYESHHRLEASEGFRRAQTAQKTPSQNEPGSQRESYISAQGAEADKVQAPLQEATFLKYLSIKWRIFTVILMILILGTAVWKGGSSTTRRPHRKVRSL